jgi:hypothetical protein
MDSLPLVPLTMTASAWKSAPPVSAKTVEAVCVPTPVTLVSWPRSARRSGHPSIRASASAYTRSASRPRDRVVRRIDARSAGDSPGAASRAFSRAAAARRSSRRRVRAWSWRTADRGGRYAAGYSRAAYSAISLASARSV